MTRGCICSKTSRMYVCGFNVMNFRGLHCLVFSAPSLAEKATGKVTF